jgi:hypothetical protein
MRQNYGVLRLWATVLVIVGVVGLVSVAIGTIMAVVQSVSIVQGLAILLFGAPLAVLYAIWPIAMGQALRALADVAEYVRDQQGVPAERLSEGEKAPRD